MRIVFVLLLLGWASANECEFGEWGEWSEWSEWLDAEHDPTIESYPADLDGDYDEYDVGREMMGILMELHEERMEYKEDCIDDETCPELFYKKSEGFMPCIDGYSNGTYPCSNVDQLSFVDFEDLFVDFDDDRVPSGNDCWGWYDALEGDEYALMGITSGVSFVRITDPFEPVTVGYIKSHGGGVPVSWRDVKVIGDWAYIVSENLDHGIQIFDLTRLRGRTTPAYLEPDTRYDKVGNCHNIVANEQTNFVYGVGCTYGNRTEYELCLGGLHAVDVSDPLNPQFAGCFGGDRYVHDAQCVIYEGPDEDYQDREVCFCYNEDTFTIVDVEDKDNMTVISKFEYEYARYTHQGWITEDFRIALLDDELDEYFFNETNGDRRTKTYIWNIEDLDAPELKNTFIHPRTSIDHNQYIIDDITYQANYESGLRILRIDSANYNLTEIAYFDVFPSRTSALFFGSWNVYPYLPSRNLVVSSIDYGLFILRPDYSIIDNPDLDIPVHKERTRYREVLDDIYGDSCPALEEIERE